MYPSTNGTRIGDIMDGTAHTIMCVETMDDSQSIWTYGTDVTLVGLSAVGDPSGSSSSGSGGTFSGQVTGFVNTTSGTATSSGTVNYYMPQGFTGNFDDAGNMIGTGGVGLFDLCELPEHDFRPNHTNAGKYPPFYTGNQTVSKCNAASPSESNVEPAEVRPFGGPFGYRQPFDVRRLGTFAQ